LEAATEIKEIAKMSYIPQVFCIDSIPMNLEEKNVSDRTRGAIMAYLLSLRPVSTTDFRVEKPHAIQVADDLKIRGLKGEITGYNGRLKQLNQEATVVLDKIEKLSKDKQEFITEIGRLTAECNDKNSDELVISHLHPIAKPFQFLQWQRDHFTVPSSWFVDNYQKWTNGHCIFEDIKKEDYSVSGSIAGDFCRGIYASITLQTKKLNRYEKELKETIIPQLRIEEERLKNVVARLKELEEANSQFDKDIQSLNAYILERESTTTHLSKRSMTIQEAEERLAELSAETSLSKSWELVQEK